MNNPSENIATLIALIIKGDSAGLARAISIVENNMKGADEILRRLQPGKAQVLGFTGPPGAGKSTLINAFLKQLNLLKKKVAVIAVDPTSPFNFGSLLGDRLRMSEHFNDKNIFIRSIASRGSLGGLSEKIIEITDVLRSADFDYIIIETVGVGQSEVEIAGLADTTIVMLVPESGDDIQSMKSGIMEIADIFIVNKSDREGADLFSNNLKKMLHLKKQSDWAIPVINTIATEDFGTAELLKHIQLHHISAGFNEKRILLLSEKAYQLIRNFRMKDLQRKEIREKLEKAMKDKSFNLYTFADQFNN